MQVPDGSLSVVGYRCAVFRSDVVATRIEQGRHLIPLHADSPSATNETVTVDRYDARVGLSQQQLRVIKLLFYFLRTLTADKSGARQLRPTPPHTPLKSNFLRFPFSFLTGLRKCKRWFYGGRKWQEGEF
jgi:hypothetical protein